MREKAVTLAIQDEAGQPAGRECPGIYIDSIRQDFGSLHRSMAVHDDLAEIHGTVEKLIADP